MPSLIRFYEPPPHWETTWWAYLSTHPFKRLNSFCYDDDEEEEDYTLAVTAVLSTEEPDNSLSMGDEHLDTIPATELDKASPPDSELVSSEVMVIVIPEVGGIDDDIRLTINDDILRETLLNFNHRFAKIEALNDIPTPFIAGGLDHVNPVIRLPLEHGISSIAGGLDHVNPVIRLPLEHGISRGSEIAGIIRQTKDIYSGNEESTTVDFKEYNPEYKREHSAIDHLLGFKWEVMVMNDQNINVVCLHGGKIVMFTELKHFTAVEEIEIATVIGHEQQVENDVGKLLNGVHNLRSVFQYLLDHVLEFL
nr:mitochondrial metalloendopeptidase OMA1-like [Tanacetum cinerariifolium]